MGPAGAVSQVSHRHGSNLFSSATRLLLDIIFIFAELREHLCCCPIREDEFYFEIEES